MVSRVKTTGTGRMPGSWPWQSRSVCRLLQSKTVREEGGVGGGGVGRETFEVVSSAVWSRVLEWMVMSWASFWLAWSAVSVKAYMPRTPRGRVETAVRKRLSL